MLIALVATRARCDDLMFAAEYKKTQRTQASQRAQDATSAIGTDIQRAIFNSANNSAQIFKLIFLSDFLYESLRKSVYYQ